MLDPKLIARALNAVVTNKQAVKAANDLLAMGRTAKLVNVTDHADVRLVAGGYYSPTAAHRRIENAMEAIRRKLPAFVTTGTAPFNRTSWESLRSELNLLVSEIAGLEGAVGAIPGLGTLVVMAAEEVSKAPARVASVVGKVAAEAAGVVGGTAWALVKPLLPVLAVVLVIGVGGLVIYRTVTR